MDTDDRTDETPNAPLADRRHTVVYEIRVTGRLGPRWESWFDGLDLTTGDDDTTLLRGPVDDQAALHGLLRTLRDLGVTLVSLAELPPDTSAPGPTARRHEGTRP